MELVGDGAQLNPFAAQRDTEFGDKARQAQRRQVLDRRLDLTRGDVDVEVGLGAQPTEPGEISKQASRRKASCRAARAIWRQSVAILARLQIRPTLENLS